MRLHPRIFTLLTCLLMSVSVTAQTQDQVDRMTKAVQFDDLTEVKKLIAAGVSPNLLVKGGNPLTVYAVREKSKQILDYLIGLKGVDVDHPNLSGISGELSIFIPSASSFIFLSNKLRFSRAPFSSPSTLGC